MKFMQTLEIKSSFCSLAYIHQAIQLEKDFLKQRISYRVSQFLNFLEIVVAVNIVQPLLTHMRIYQLASYMWLTLVTILEHDTTEYSHNL